MSGNLTSVLGDSIKQMAQTVVKEELRQFRAQLQDICLHAVEGAFGQHLKSEKFRQTLRQEIGGGGSAPDPKSVEAAVTKVLGEKGGALLQGDAIEQRVNNAIAGKAKEIFKQTMMAGSLDIRKVIAAVVEKSLAARGGAATGAPADLTQQIQGEVRSFFASNEMKELLEQKFRAIDIYLKTDLIPKIVKREIGQAAKGA